MIVEILQKTKIMLSDMCLTDNVVLGLSTLGISIVSSIATFFIFDMYASPDFLIMMANQVWGCF